MAGTTRLELAISAVTALREMALQQLTSTRGMPNAEQVVRGHSNCRLDCGLRRQRPTPLPFEAARGKCYEVFGAKLSKPEGDSHSAIHQEIAAGNESAIRPHQKCTDRSDFVRRSRPAGRRHFQHFPGHPA